MNKPEDLVEKFKVGAEKIKNEFPPMPNYKRIQESPAYKLGYEDASIKAVLNITALQKESDAIKKERDAALGVVNLPALDDSTGELSELQRKEAKLEQWQACYAALFNQLTGMKKENDRLRGALLGAHYLANNSYNWLIVNWEKDGELIADELQPELRKIMEKASKALNPAEGEQGGK